MLAGQTSSRDRSLVPGSPQRVRQMAALREQGWGLVEIATQFDVSRERVRQILRAQGGPDPRTVAEARRLRARRLADARIDELLALWRLGEDPGSAARGLGLQGAACRAAIERFATEVDRAARAARMAGARSALIYSDRDIALALTSAAGRLGRVPSAKEYVVLARAMQLPSLATILNRMGGWSNAVGLAGLRPVAPVRNRTRRWTDEACWTALQRAVDELGAMPSVRAYERLAAGHDDLPSSATIRNRLGRWSALTARLAVQRELTQQVQVRPRTAVGALAGA